MRTLRKSSQLLLPVFVAVSLLVATQAAQAQAYQEKGPHSFTRGADGGAPPEAGLVRHNGESVGDRHWGRRSNLLRQGRQSRVQAGYNRQPHRPMRLYRNSPRQAPRHGWSGTRQEN